MSFSDNKGTFLDRREARSADPNDLLSFMDSLPEAQPMLYVGILTDFLDRVRQATSLTEVNVAAGIAHARLMGKPS